MKTTIILLLIILITGCAGAGTQRVILLPNGGHNTNYDHQRFQQEYHHLETQRALNRADQLNRIDYMNRQ